MDGGSDGTNEQKRSEGRLLAAIEMRNTTLIAIKLPKKVIF